jgi:hypothetical protein
MLNAEKLLRIPETKLFITEMKVGQHIEGRPNYTVRMYNQTEGRLNYTLRMLIRII